MAIPVELIAPILLFIAVMIVFAFVVAKLQAKSRKLRELQELYTPIIEVDKAVEEAKAISLEKIKELRSSYQAATSELEEIRGNLS